MSGLQQIVRWLKVRTSGRGRGRSKERSCERSKSNCQKELPHPSACSSPVFRTSDSDLPDVLAHSPTKCPDDIWSDDEEDLLQLQRNTPQRRTLPPIPLDQSPYKPGISDKDTRRPRSSSVDQKHHGADKKVVPVYEEIPNWALDPDAGTGKCAPYLVVAIPQSDGNEPLDAVLLPDDCDIQMEENLLDDQEVARISESVLRCHEEKDCNPSIQYLYRYSTVLKTPEKGLDHTKSSDGVLESQIPSPIARTKRSPHSSTDHDSVDEFYEYDIDSSCGQSASELSSPAKYDDEDYNDELLSGVYPLPGSSPQDQQRSKVMSRSGGSRSQSDSSNDTYNEYDGGYEMNTCYQAEVARVHKQLQLSRHISSQNSSGVMMTLTANDIMTQQRAVKPYVVTDICPGTGEKSEISNANPHLPYKMKHQQRTSDEQSQVLMSPLSERRPGLQPHNPSNPLFGHRSPSPTKCSGGCPEDSTFLKRHAGTKCDKCGHSNSDSDGGSKFSVLDGKLIALPHWKPANHQPRPTLGVSAMCIRKKNQFSGIRTIAATSRKGHISRTLDNQAEPVQTLPERSCRSRQPFREKSRSGSPFTTSDILTSRTQHKSKSRGQVLKFDLPTQPTDKFSCRVTAPGDHVQLGSKTRLRKNSQLTMGQNVPSQQQNRLLHDLMQVNFDRQNLATA